MKQLCLWIKIRTKQWLVLGASTCQCMRAGFLCPKCSNFVSLHTRQDLNQKMIFVLPKSPSSPSRSPFSEAKTHWMVNWLQLLNQLDFLGRQTKVFMQNSSQWWLRNIQWVRTMVNWFWRRFTYPFCHSSNILGCMLWFIDEDASSFHLFPQDNEHTELTVLLL